MTNPLRLGSIAALIFTIATVDGVFAQTAPLGPPPQRQPGLPPQAAPMHTAGGMGVAIIDLNYILKHHTGFNQRREALQRQADDLEAKFKAKRDGIQKMMVQLQDYSRGSPEYKNLETEITKQQADYQVEVARIRKDLAEADAKNSYEVYRQIAAEVNYYAEANHIGLVVKFDGDAANADKDNPEEIVREIQNLVMYNHPSVDITPIILDRLQQKQGGPAQPTAGRQPLPPRR